MARPSEIKETMWNKWLGAKGSDQSSSSRRPHLASDCSSLGEAEKWRGELVRDITKKIAGIQNASLEEHIVRDLNDDINKLVRTKFHWEVRIRELGGPDHKKTKTAFDVEGKELPGVRGYKYYGAAKALPGVKEIFEEFERFGTSRSNNMNDSSSSSKRSRTDLYRSITPAYYGYGVTDDENLLAEEAEMESKLRIESLKAYEDKQKEMEVSGAGFSLAGLSRNHGSDDDGDAVDYAAIWHGSDSVIGSIPISIESEDQALIEEKKRALLDQYS
jgi:pre-mRNA-splicing factor ISY1